MDFLPKVLTLMVLSWQKVGFFGADSAGDTTGKVIINAVQLNGHIVLDETSAKDAFKLRIVHVKI